MRIDEGPTAADRHEARISDLGEDHGRDLYHLHAPPPWSGAMGDGAILPTSTRALRRDRRERHIPREAQTAPIRAKQRRRAPAERAAPSRR
jgi:hypothetical protein